MALSDNLVAYYTMENTSDSVGGFNLTATNATTGTAGGIKNNCVQFAGVAGNKLSMGSSSSLDLGTGSISVWIKTTWTGVTRQVIYSRGDTWTTATGITLSLTDSNTVAIYMGVNYVVTTMLTNANTYIPANTWTHIVLTWTSGSQTLYINGTQVGTASRSYNAAATSESRIGLRGEVPTGTDYFNGYMDEFALWSRQITAGEVTTLYNSGAGKTYPFGTDYTKSLTDDFTLSDIKNGLNFDGQANTYVQLPTIALTSFSVEAWVKTNTPTTTQTIFGRSAGTSDLLDINGTTPGTIRLNLLTSAGTVNINTTGTFSMDTNVHHVLATFDATTGIGSIYVDGVLSVQSGAIGAASLTNTGAWKIGALATNTRNFNGTINGVRVWNVVLNATEASQLAGNPKTIPQPGAVIANWNMSDGSGGALSDVSGSGYNGSLVGGVTWNPLLFFKQENKALLEGLAVNDGNQVRNGYFGLQPTFVAPQTTYDTWIDGTATGSASDNRWGWKHIRASLGTGTGSFQYTTFAGLPCMKITTTAMAHDGVTTSIFGIGQTSYPGGTMAGNNEKSWMIPINPKLTYKYSYDHYVTQIDPKISFRMYGTYYDSAMNRISTINPGSAGTVESQWNTTASTFTPPSNAAFIQISAAFFNTVNSNPSSQGGTAYVTNIVVAPQINSGSMLIRAINQIKSDTLTITEIFTKAANRVNSEVLSLSENIIKQTGKRLYDATNWTAGMVAHYKMTEMVNGTVADSSGYANDLIFKISASGYYPFDGNANDASFALKNGTVTGASLTNDRFGNGNSAYAFTGNGQYIQSAIAATSVRAFSMWVKCTGNNTSGNAVFGSVGGTDVQWYKQATNQWFITFSYGGTRYYFSNGGTGIAPIADGNWHHYTATFNQSTFKLTLFVDGVMTLNAIGASSTLASAGTTSIQLGSAASEGNIPCAGLCIDEALFLPYNLSTNNMTNLYNLEVAHDLNKPIISSGKFGNAIDFWGQDVAAANAPGNTLQNNGGVSNQITGQSPWTISAWYKLPAAGVNNNCIGWYGGNYKGPYFNVSFTNISIVVGQGNTTGVNSNLSANHTISISGGVWNHIVVQYDGVNINSYVNGVLTGSTFIGQYIDNGTGGQRFAINSNPWDYNRLGTSKYDDVRVYNRALTSAEIANLYNMTNPDYESFTRAINAIKTDTLSFVETLTKAFTRTLTDSYTTAESFVKRALKSLTTENITTTDQGLIRTFTRTLTDVQTWVDKTLEHTVIKLFTDTINLQDNLIRKLLTELKRKGTTLLLSKLKNRNTILQTKESGDITTLKSKRSGNKSTVIN